MILRKTSRAHVGWRILAALSLSLAILSFVSPQVAELGHGLRTTLPAMVVAWFATTRISPHAYRRAFLRFNLTVIFAFFFLIQAAFRFAYANDSSPLWRSFVEGPLEALGLLLCVAGYAELGEEAMRVFRGNLLFGWCICLGLGLPTLINNPRIARETMGVSWASENAAVWAPQGVGEYGIYTSLAICISPLIFAARSLRGAWRLLAYILIVIAAGSVLFSTFTGAAVLLVLSLLGSLFVWIVVARGIPRMRRTIIALLAIALLPFLYSLAILFPQTERSVSKIGRLYQGISSSGLVQGEETGRGEMFEEDIRSFSEEPILGYVPRLTGQRDHGHSSLASSFVLFGLFGAILWFATLGSVFRRSFRQAKTSTAKGVLLVSWSIFVLGGILNPIWYSPAALGALFALTVPSRSDSEQTDSPERFTQRSLVRERMTNSGWPT